MYPGNLPGQVGDWENTRCHHCQATVIRRYGFLVQQNRVGPTATAPIATNPSPASGQIQRPRLMAACGRCSKADAPIGKACKSAFMRG